MRAEAGRGQRVRLALRVTAFAISLALVGLWIRFLLATFGSVSVGGVPAPGAFMVTTLFSCVAVAGGVSALKDVPVAVALTGLVSLIPVGVFLLIFPWSIRLIGVLDAAMLVLGIALMRMPGGPADLSSQMSEEEPPEPGSFRPTSP